MILFRLQASWNQIAVAVRATSRQLASNQRFTHTWTRFLLLPPKTLALQSTKSPIHTHCHMVHHKVHPYCQSARVLKRRTITCLEKAAPEVVAQKVHILLKTRFLLTRAPLTVQCRLPPIVSYRLRRPVLRAAMRSTLTRMRR